MAVCRKHGCTAERVPQHTLCRKHLTQRKVAQKKKRDRAAKLDALTATPPAEPTWAEKHPPLPRKVADKLDKEQRRIDWEARQVIGRCLTLDPPRVLSPAEIAAIAHTITPIWMISDGGEGYAV